MVWRCACGLDLILQLILSLFHFVNFVSFRRCDINFTEVQSIFYKGNLRYLIKNDSQGLPNFFENI